MRLFIHINQYHVSSTCIYWGLSLIIKLSLTKHCRLKLQYILCTWWVGLLPINLFNSQAQVKGSLWFLSCGEQTERGIVCEIKLFRWRSCPQIKVRITLKHSMQLSEFSPYFTSHLIFITSKNEQIAWKFTGQMSCYKLESGDIMLLFCIQRIILNM